MKINDKVRVVNDWMPAEAKKKRAQITGFQKNGNITFAKLLWLGSDSQLLAETCGTLFPLDELRPT